MANFSSSARKLEYHVLLLALYKVPDMVFMPSLDNVADSFYDLVDSLVGDIYKQASLVPRLASHSGQEHYQVGVRVCSGRDGWVYVV